MKRLPLIVTLVCLALAAGALLALPALRTPADGPVPRFHLTDHHGATVTEANLQGQVSVIYFGYTFCPDVCPTELSYLSRVLKALGSDGDQVTPLFVSVDPERDTQATLASYAPYFDKRLRGLTGSPDAVTAACQAFGVVARRVEGTPGSNHYLMDHTSTIFVLDRHGRVAARISSHDPIAQAVTTIRALLESP